MKYKNKTRKKEKWPPTKSKNTPSLEAFCAMHYSCI